MHGFDAQNFVCTIVESQLTGQLTDTAGDPTPAALLLNALDKAFTAIFTVELVVNMASNLWTRFVHDPWCLLSCSRPLPLCFLSFSILSPSSLLFMQSFLFLFANPHFLPHSFPSSLSLAVPLRHLIFSEFCFFLSSVFSVRNIAVHCPFLSPFHKMREGGLDFFSCLAP